MPQVLKSLSDKLRIIPNYSVVGKVSNVKGLLIEVTGIAQFASIGSSCDIKNRENRNIHAEVVGFQGDKTLVMPFKDVVGIGAGCEVYLKSVEQVIYPCDEWRGRVINCFGEPIDNKGPLPKGLTPYFLKADAPPAHARKRVKDKLNMGVRAVNTLTTCCVGQRLGVFAGSGVGKSMMLAMFTKFASTDVKVIGLIGERGREVQEFIEDYLGEEGLKNAVVIVATSDESALAKRQAAYVMMAVSEYFRDQKKEVLMMIDSITRFAMAQREIGLSSGEPPTTKGYTPSVFVELPKLLERAGTGTSQQGSITALVSVLVEGDDNNEPIADAVRAILDGHIVLDRAIAARGRFPAIDVINSISRTMPMCNDEYQNALITEAKKLISSYNDMSDMIRIGAYKHGSDPDVDKAIQYHQPLEKFLGQDYKQGDDMESSYEKLAACIDFRYAKK
jgi:flagellum-specific ATP synthase